MHVFGEKWRANLWKIKEDSGFLLLLCWSHKCHSIEIYMISLLYFKSFSSQIVSENHYLITASGKLIEEYKKR